MLLAGRQEGHLARKKYLIFTFFSLCYAAKHHIHSQGNETLIICCLLNFLLSKSTTGNSRSMAAMLFMWLSRQNSFKNLVKSWHENKKLKKNKKIWFFIFFLNRDVFQLCHCHILQPWSRMARQPRQPSQCSWVMTHSGSMLAACSP